MIHFENWMQELGIDKSDTTKATALGKVVAECYMHGFEEGLFTLETEVLDVTEAKFIGDQLGKLVGWYLEDTAEPSE